MPIRTLISLLIAGTFAVPAFSQIRSPESIPLPPNWNIDRSIGPGVSPRQASSGRDVFFLSGDKIFPHLAVGGGWETVLVLLNMSNATVNVKQTFRDTLGREMPVTYRMIPSGGERTNSTIELSLPSMQSFNIVLRDSSSTVKTGWAELEYSTSNARIGGYAIFRQKVAGRPDFEAPVPLSGNDDSVFFMPYDNLEGATTSMALLNPGTTESTTVLALVLDVSGAEIARDIIVLPPRNQVSFMIPEKFPSTFNRVGTILFVGTTNRLSALGFRFNPSGAFSTIPIMNW